MSAVEAVREAGCDASILLISDEDRIPYKRTKISKRFSDLPDSEAFALHERQWYRDNAVELLESTRLEVLGGADNTLTLSDQSKVSFDHLVFATGAEPIDPVISGEHTVDLYPPYRQSEVEKLITAVGERMHAGGEPVRVAMFGGGVVSIEVSEQLRQMGADVTLFSRTGRLMARELDDYAHMQLLETLSRNGIRIRPRPGVRFLEDLNGGVEIHFSDGENEWYSLLILASGTTARISVAKRSGLKTKNGVLVDTHLRTSHPSVFACGDCAEHPDGRVTHLWRDAKRQGTVAGRNVAAMLAGKPLEPYVYQPFRLKCEVFGHYFYSIGEPEPKSMHHDGYEREQYVEDNRYVSAWYVGGHLSGLVMMDDRDRRDEYTQAVVEQWRRDRFREEFALTTAR